jgi:hypothetical protein
LGLLRICAAPLIEMIGQPRQLFGSRTQRA